MLTLTEPIRGQAINHLAIKLVNQYARLAKITIVGADLFLIIYPIFLLTRYIYGIVHKQIQAKIGALRVFFACFFSLIFNLFIQCFFAKPRPIAEFLGSNVGETALHQFLPNSAFPSDHAVVGMAVAIATLLRAFHLVKYEQAVLHKSYKISFLKKFSIFLIICAVLMGICRIFTIVHRPTDIIGGFIIGSIIPLFLSQRPIFSFLKKRLIKPTIRFQEWLFSLCSK